MMAKSSSGFLFLIYCLVVAISANPSDFTPVKGLNESIFRVIKNVVVPFTFETFEYGQFFQFSGQWDTGRHGIIREYLRLKLYRFIEIFLEARSPYSFFGSRSKLTFYDRLGKVTLEGSGTGSPFDWPSIASAAAAVQIFLPDQLLSSVQVTFSSKSDSRSYGPVRLRVDAVDFEIFPAALHNTRYYYPGEYMPAAAGRGVLENFKTEIHRQGSSALPLAIQKFVEGDNVMLQYSMKTLIAGRPATPMTYENLTEILDYLIGFFGNDLHNTWHPFVYVVYWSQRQQVLELRLFNATGYFDESSNESGLNMTVS